MGTGSTLGFGFSQPTPGNLEGEAQPDPRLRCTQSDPAAFLDSRLKEGRGGGRPKVKDLLLLPLKIPYGTYSRQRSPNPRPALLQGGSAGLRDPRAVGREEIPSVHWLPGGVATRAKEGSGPAPAEVTGSTDRELQDERRANAFWHFLEAQGQGRGLSMDYPGRPPPPTRAGPAAVPSEKFPVAPTEGEARAAVRCCFVPPTGRKRPELGCEGGERSFS